MIKSSLVYNRFFMFALIINIHCAIICRANNIIEIECQNKTCLQLAFESFLSQQNLNLNFRYVYFDNKTDDGKSPIFYLLMAGEFFSKDSIAYYWPIIQKSMEDSEVIETYTIQSKLHHNRRFITKRQWNMRMFGVNEYESKKCVLIELTNKEDSYIRYWVIFDEQCNILKTIISNGHYDVRRCRLRQGKI